jgi:hypothetical protein
MITAKNDSKSGSPRKKRFVTGAAFGGVSPHVGHAAVALKVAPHIGHVLPLMIGHFSRVEAFARR